MFLFNPMNGILIIRSTLRGLLKATQQKNGTLMGISNTIPPSRLIQPGVVANTAARPTSPFEGQAIYQTDTDEVLYYNGTSWSRPWNMPWGQVGYASRTSAFTLSTSSTDVTGLSATWTAVSGRMYKTTAFVYFSVGSGTGNLFVSVADSAGTRVAEGGTYAAATSYPSINVVGYSTGLSGSQTRKVKSNFLGITAATTLAAADYPSVIIVEDIGPA
jgi:hypothetical protein